MVRVRNEKWLSLVGPRPANPYLVNAEQRRILAAEMDAPMKRVLLSHLTDAQWRRQRPLKKQAIAARAEFVALRVAVS